MAEEPSRTWAMTAIAAVITAVGKGFNLFPSDPFTLILIGFSCSMLFLLAQIIYSGMTGQTEKLMKTEQEYAKEAQKGHAFAVAILLLMKEQNAVWMTAAAYAKLYDVLSNECSSIIDTTSGGRTIKLLVLMKYCADARTKLKRIDIKPDEPIPTGLRTRMTYSFDLVENGPKNSNDLKLVEDIPNINVEARIVVDHLTQSLCLLLVGAGRLPDYIKVLQENMVASKYGNGLHTFPSVEEAVDSVLHSEKISELLGEFKNYKLSLAGFGLGASAATLLSYALVADEKPGPFQAVEFEAYAFAPLPCISTATPSQEVEERLVTLVSSDDMAPRLTPQKLRHIQDSFKLFGEAVEAQRLVDECITPDGLSTELHAEVDKALKQTPGVVNALEEGEIEEGSPRHVGQLYWLSKDTCGNISQSLLSRACVFEKLEFLSGHEMGGYSSRLKALK